MSQCPTKHTFGKDFDQHIECDIRCNSSVRYLCEKEYKSKYDQSKWEESTKRTDFKPIENIEIRTLSCIECGRVELLVGKGVFRTVIKCPHCGWEDCIHGGEPPKKKKRRR